MVKEKNNFSWLKKIAFVEWNGQVKVRAFFLYSD